jgi:hypothetical protein
MGGRQSVARRLGIAGLVGGFVLLALIVLAGIIVIRSLGGREVGPDADEMAKDLLLHLELENAEPEEILARTGREGGVMPAMTKRSSSASRRWHVQGGDWESVASGVAQTAGDRGMSFWRMRCTQNTVIYRGAKVVDLGDDAEVMYAGIHVERQPAEDTVSIFVYLESSESELDEDDPSNPSLDPVDESCPTGLVEQFEQLRAG